MAAASPAMPASGRVSPVAQAVRRAFPLRDVVGDHAGRLHGRLAELGVAGNLPLHPLPSACSRSRRLSSSDTRFSISVSDVPATRWISELTLLTVASAVASSAGSAVVTSPGAAPEIGDVVAHEVADPRFDFGHGGEIAVFDGGFDFFGCNFQAWRSSAVPCFALERARMSPARRKLNSAISPADFDQIGANLRQCPIFPGGIARSMPQPLRPREGAPEPCGIDA